MASAGVALLVCFKWQWQKLYIKKHRKKIALKNILEHLGAEIPGFDRNSEYTLGTLSDLKFHKNFFLWLERCLNSEEHLLPLQRIQI